MRGSLIQVNKRIIKTKLVREVKPTWTYTNPNSGEIQASTIFTQAMFIELAIKMIKKKVEEKWTIFFFFKSRLNFNLFQTQKTWGHLSFLMYGSLFSLWCSFSFSIMVARARVYDISKLNGECEWWTMNSGGIFHEGKCEEFRENKYKFLKLNDYQNR